MEEQWVDFVEAMLTWLGPVFLISVVIGVLGLFLGWF